MSHIDLNESLSMPSFCICFDRITEIRALMACREGVQDTLEVEGIVKLVASQLIKCHKYHPQILFVEHIVVNH